VREDFRVFETGQKKQGRLGVKKLFSGKKRGGDMRSLHSVLRAEQIKGKVFTKMQKTACWMTGILSVLLLLTWVPEL